MPIIYPKDMKYVSKSWGWELHICNNEKYCGKKLFIKQGWWLSFHHHNIKDEVLFVESGVIWFTNDESSFLEFPTPAHVFTESPKLTVGHAFHVVPGVKHQMQAIEDTVLFEFSTQHFDEDSIRTTRDLVFDHSIYYDMDKVVYELQGKTL